MNKNRCINCACLMPRKKKAAYCSLKLSPDGQAFTPLILRLRVCAHYVKKPEVLQISFFENIESQ